MNKAARTTSKAASIFTVLFVMALLAMSAAPAFAHHKADHEQGTQAEDTTTDEREGKGSDSDRDGDAGNTETPYTESNDTNDNGTGEDVADDGDNAHPSTKDRSVENGSSTSNPNQGKSESDPDDDGRGPERTNGGYDKPNGTGGVDKADQDGNNGCGNDDDFEDDNEGWCGKKPAKPVKVNPIVEDKKVCPAGSDFPGKEMNNLKDCFEDEVKGEIEIRCPAGTDRAGLPMDELKDCDRDDVLGGVITNPATPKTDDVLGKVIHNAAPQVRADQALPAAEVLGGVLPFTGSTGIAFLAALGIGLIALGALTFALKARKA